MKLETAEKITVKKALKDCLDEFASRDRRFGGLTS